MFTQGRADPFGVVAHFRGTVEAAELSRCREPTPASGSIESRCWATCPCGEAGFLYKCFLPVLGPIRRTLPGSGVGCLPFTRLAWEATHPSCKSSKAVILRRGAASSVSPGPVFSRGYHGSYFSAPRLPVCPLLPLSLPLASDGKRSEEWVVHNLQLS